MTRACTWFIVMIGMLLSLAASGPAGSETRLTIAAHPKSGRLVRLPPRDEANDRLAAALIAFRFVVFEDDHGTPGFLPAGELGDRLRNLDAHMRVTSSEAMVSVFPLNNSKDPVTVYWSSYFALATFGFRAILIAAEGVSMPNAAACSAYAVGRTVPDGLGQDATARVRSDISNRAFSDGGNGRTGGGTARAEGYICKARGGTGSDRLASAPGGNAYAESTAGIPTAKGGHSSPAGGRGGSANARGGSPYAVGGDSLGEFDPEPGGSADAETTSPFRLSGASAFAQGGRGGGIIGVFADLQKLNQENRQAGKGGYARAFSAYHQAEAVGGKGGPAQGYGVISGDGGDAKAIGRVPIATPGQPGDTDGLATSGVTGERFSRTISTPR